MPDTIKIYKENATLVLELARPKVFNCLSMQVFAELRDGLTTAEKDKSIRAVLIRAEGKHFCTGAQLGEVKEKIADKAELDGFLALGHEVLCRFEASRLPVVGQVQGLCLAGGLELALACDVVIAGRSATFGDQHAQFGLVPGWGGSARLPRAVGMGRAMDLFLSVRWLDAETAERWGLVNYVVDDSDLAATSLEYCAKLATRSGPGLAGMKQLAREGIDTSLDGALTLERLTAPDFLMSANVAEGIAAFEGKRDPVFPEA
ncbi:enoyl-CoA hydratase [Pseudooceanicola nanhaiensis]|jgi:enoyl-CoA hydratase/carnithine racemase|uniref:Enoyl-CoA hydratase n=1 Tax=Pseudooceanicola nanhaiensis TaxID=375761 RepID=A0A917TAJ4_9RHOB|nr:enoyl-CoA hydratase/isomerase family protein [Pseudooceanicola nanhaiensis]GGM15892.1 enoyl-CoA hydratase [Pseudooceanicola nanhaiensis]